MSGTPATWTLILINIGVYLLEKERSPLYTVRCYLSTMTPNQMDFRPVWTEKMRN